MMRNKRITHNHVSVDEDEFLGAFQVTEEVLFPETRKPFPPVIPYHEEVESAGSEEDQLENQLEQKAQARKGEKEKKG